MTRSALGIEGYKLYGLNLRTAQKINVLLLYSGVVAELAGWSAMAGDNWIEFIVVYEDGRRATISLTRWTVTQGDFIARAIAIEKQKALGLVMMEAVGFDFEHGRLDVSHHPFCGGVPTDIRMTTRYTEGEFITSLMGIMHETGHGLYEQNLPHEWTHWPVGRARGMAMHESQSLFVEKEIARSPEFWEWALPHVKEKLGA